MKIAIFLALGDSLTNMAKSGQDVRFKKFYLKKFSQEFEKVYVFSYSKEKVSGIPKNVILIPNKLKLHRYFYGLFLPFINRKQVQEANVIRAYHLSGTVPAIISKIFFGKKFIFNFAYDYQTFAKIENKQSQYLLFKFLQPLAIYFAHKIFAANKNILKLLPLDKTVYLPNGVDTSIFKPRSKKPKHKAPVILSVGRLEEQKNYENLILALKGTKAKLKIIGNGSLESNLINLANKYKVNLEIIHKVPNTRMSKIYNNATLFVLLSKIEGSPKVLMEAMACGLPVIGTRVEGIEELIINGKTGILIDKPTPENVNKTIKKAINNHEFRKKLASNAIIFTRKHFNLSILLKEEIKYLKNL